MKKRELEKRVATLEQAVGSYRHGRNALIDRVLELEKQVMELKRPAWRYIPYTPTYPPCCPSRPCNPWKLPYTPTNPWEPWITYTDTTGNWGSDGVQWTYTASNSSGYGDGDMGAD